MSGETDYFWLTVSSWMETFGFPIQSMRDYWGSPPTIGLESHFSTSQLLLPELADILGWQGALPVRLTPEFSSPKSDPVILRCIDSAPVAASRLIFYPVECWSASLIPVLVNSSHPKVLVNKEEWAPELRPKDKVLYRLLTLTRCVTLGNSLKDSVSYK